MNGKHSIRVWLSFALVTIVWGGVCIASIFGYTERYSKLDLGRADFGAIYSAAVVVGEGRWDLLYPENVSDDTPHSHPAPELYSLLQERKSVHVLAWLYPPPAALFFAPLSLFDYPEAKNVWIVLNLAFFLLFLVLILREYRELGLVGTQFVVPTILIFGLGYPAYNAMQCQNLNFGFALLLLLALRGVRKQQSFWPAVASVFIGATKGGTVVWMPLFLLWKRWRILFLCLGLSCVLLLTSFAVGCRLDTYVRFFCEIVPSAKRFLQQENNEGLPLLLKTCMSTENALFLSNVVLLFSCVALYWREFFFGFRDPSSSGLRSALVLCIAFLLFQMTNNVCWVHYRVHLMAFAPTLLACCGARSRIGLLAFVALSANFLFIPRLFLKVFGLVPGQVPVLVANFGVVLHLFLLVVMVLALRKMERRQSN